MSKRLIGILLFFSCISLSFFCKKSSKGCNNYTPPSSLFFQIKKNGTILPDIVLNNMRLSYFDGSKKYINDLSHAVDYYANMGIMTTRTIGTLGARTYVFEYNDNSLINDTLFANYTFETPTTNCQYQLLQIKFNNAIVTADTTFGYQPVYIFNKK